MSQDKHKTERRDLSLVKAAVEHPYHPNYLVLNSRYGYPRKLFDSVVKRGWMHIERERSGSFFGPHIRYTKAYVTPLGLIVYRRRVNSAR